MQMLMQPRTEEQLKEIVDRRKTAIYQDAAQESLERGGN